MTGRTGGPRRRRQPLGLPGPGAGGEDDGGGAQLLARGRAHPGDPLALDQGLDDLRAGAGPPPRPPPAPRAARRLSARGSTEASPGAWTPPRQRRRQARLELAAGGRGEPLGVEAEAALQVVDPAQLGRLVAVERDVQRAGGLVAGRAPARLLELGDEGRVELGGDQGQLEQLAARRRSARRPGPASRPRRGSRPPEAARGRGRAPRRPAWARRQAQERPMTPPPTMIASKLRFSVNLPPPALPGSGPDGRWPRCHPLSPRGLPCTDATPPIA